MNDQHDDMLGVPGVPGQTPPPSSGSKAPKPADAGALPPGADREGETGLGVPEASRDARQLSEEEEQAMLAAISEAEKAEALELIDELAQEYDSFQLPGFLRKPAAALIVLMIGLFTLFLTTQVVSALNDFAQIESIYLRGLAYGVLAISGLVVLYSIVRLMGFVLRLRANRQIRPAVLRELSERSHLHQAMAREHFKDAVKSTQRYLREYPDLSERKQQRRMQLMGLDPATCEEIERARARLLDDARRGEERAWLAEFERDFQTHLDAAAQKRISRAAWQAGFATAAAPNPAIDMALIIALSFSLVGDLCRIYNLKTDRFSMVLVLGRVVTNAFVAGNLGELGKEGASALSDQLHDALGAIGAKLVGGVTSRAAEGAINGILVKRLGRTTRAMLQPVRSKA